MIEKKNQPILPRRGRFLTNFMALTCGRFLGDLATLLLIAAISRQYGQLGFGQYTVAITVSGFLMALSGFGLSNLTVKVLSGKSSDIDQDVARFLALRICLSGISFVLLLIISLFTNSANLSLTILIVGCSQIIFTLAQGLVAILMSRELMIGSAIFEFLLRIATAGGVAICALLDAPYEFMLLVFPTTNSLYFLAIAKLTIIRFGPVPIITSLENLILTFRQTFTYGISTLLFQIQGRLDILVIVFLLGTVSAGIYNAGYRVVLALIFVPSLAARSLLPVFSANSEDFETEKHHDLLSNVISTGILLAAPAFVGVFIVAPDAIALIFGNSFSDSVVILRILSPIVFITTLHHLFSTHLIGSGRQPHITKVIWWTVSGTALAFLAIVPFFGIIGAAAVTVLSQAAYCWLLGGALWNELDLRQIGKRLGIAGFACSVMILAWFIVEDYGLIVSIGFCVFVYGLVLISFKTVRQEEIKNLVKAVQRRG